MTQISVKLTGLDNIQLGINTLGAAIPEITNDDVELAMEKAGKEASGYYSGGNSYGVPEIFNQGYIRTGVYGRSTYVDQLGRSFRLHSEAPYSEYVGGDGQGQGQALIHRGRWPLIADVVRKYAESLVEKIDGHIQDAAEALGL